MGVPYTVNEHWGDFLKTIELGRDWNLPPSAPFRNTGEVWPGRFGSVLEWNPGALETARMCRAKYTHMWVASPKHSMMEFRCKSLGINIWTEREEKQPLVFLEVGLAKTEYEILDFQHHCELTGAINALLFVPCGVGMPSDLRWEWTHDLTLDSCMFGDVIAAEWRVLLYIPLLLETHCPRLERIKKRVLEDAFLEWGLECEVESDSNAQMIPIERTRGMQVLVTDALGKRRISRRSHIGALSLAEIRHPRVEWPSLLGEERTMTKNAWIGLLGGNAGMD